MAGAGRFLGGVGLAAAHLADADDFGVEAEGHVEEHVLVDVLFFVVAGPCQGVDDAVDGFAVFFLYQGQLPAAVFDGEDPFAAGDGSQEPAGEGGLAGADGARHADADAVAQAFCQEVQHFPGGGAAFHEVFLSQPLGVDDADGGGDTDVLVHKRGLQDGDADVPGLLSGRR